MAQRLLEDEANIVDEAQVVEEGSNIDMGYGKSASPNYWNLTVDSDTDKRPNGDRTFGRVSQSIYCVFVSDDLVVDVVVVVVSYNTLVCCFILLTAFINYDKLVAPPGARAASFFFSTPE